MANGRLNIENRDEFPQFVPTPKELYPTKFRIRGVRVVRVSPDETYKKLKAKNRQIDISNTEILVNGKKPIDGIFSPLFGADTTQDTPVYTCDCGELHGGENRGRVCKKCGTECRSIEADLRLQGHIDIAPYHILTYHGFIAFSKIFKKTKNKAIPDINDIISTHRKISRSGKVVKDNIPTILELYDDYDELYKDKIGLEKNIVFMSKIPVYSARLRPLIIYSQTTQSITDVNKKYLSIVKLAAVLKSNQLMSISHREIETQRNINQIQQDWNDICAFINEQINGKDGVFRHALTSGRVDNSSRLVITLGTDLRPHEIDIPYQTMMVQYEEEIANYLRRLQNIPLAKAISMVEDHVIDPDPLYINIINQLLKTGRGVWMLVNRNPTISKYGIGYMRVRKIHEDFTDMTMHLPPDCLGSYAADFDGLFKALSYRNVGMARCELLGRAKAA